MISGSYFENPGMPTDEERGVYCPHGEKVMEFDSQWGLIYGYGRRVVEPWPCDRPGCTRQRFEQELADMERELAEAEMDALLRIQHE